MNNSTDFNLLASSCFGMLRGLFVHSLIYPLEVIKIRKQSFSLSENSFRIASHIFQQEGFSSFYKGLTSQLTKTCIKQAWCWPMITTISTFLPVNNVSSYAITGFSIATVDALITTPLERIKIISAVKGKTSYSTIYKNGWHGFFTHWSKLSVNWVTFLTAQKILRDQHEEPLSLIQLSKIGVQVALIVSVVSAPFDIANTLKHAQNIRPRIHELYRGWPLNAISLIIHNIASVILIDILSKK